MNLETRIQEFFDRQTDHYGDEYVQAFDELKAALNEGRVRAAEPDSSSPTGWKVNAWVKKGILLGFRLGRIVEMPGGRSRVSPRQAQGATPESQFRDKHTYPLKRIAADQN